MHEKTCPNCEEDFETPREFQEFCSVICSQIAYAKREKEKKPKRLEYSRGRPGKKSRFSYTNW